MTPAEIVSLLSTTTPDLSSRIGTMTKVWSTPDSKITGRFHYIKFRDGKPTVEDLVTVAHARMVNFVIPRKRIDEAIAEMNAKPTAIDPWVLLATEARDLFIKTKDETGRSGELGEVLLYMLMEWVLSAPIVACKMYLKTSQQMPVHGRDGIHLGSEKDKLIMYWGESKLHQSLPSALSDISSSIAKFVGSPKDYQNEVRIIRANLNIDQLNHEARTAIKNYFNPYKPESNNYMDCFACLAGYGSRLYESVAKEPQDKSEDAFVKKFEAHLDDIAASIVEKNKKEKIGDLRFAYFLLPFPSADAARQLFQDRLWGK